MFFLRRGIAAIALFCLATSPSTRAWQANAEQEARNRIGKFVPSGIPSAMPGRYQTMADMKRALLTADAIFAAYCRTPLLSPPRGFDVLHNAHADARDTPRGWPIPAGSGFILLAYDSKRPLPKGGFAKQGEGRCWVASR